jgi:hypothetical protein
MSWKTIYKQASEIDDRTFDRKLRELNESWEVVKKGGDIGVMTNIHRIKDNLSQMERLLASIYRNKGGFVWREDKGVFSVQNMQDAFKDQSQHYGFWKGHYWFTEEGKQMADAFVEQNNATQESPNLQLNPKWSYFGQR